MTSEAKRNDPCPCGSGKKYKKCCGQPGMAKHKTEVIKGGINQPILSRIANIGASFHDKETKTLKDMNLQVGPIQQKQENSPSEEKKD